MYGQSFTLAWDAEPTWNQKTQGGAQAGPFTRARGFLAYYEVRSTKTNLAKLVVNLIILFPSTFLDLSLCKERWLAGGSGPYRQERTLCLQGQVLGQF
jgi:hypothetical protein